MLYSVETSQAPDLPGPGDTRTVSPCACSGIKSRFAPTEATRLRSAAIQEAARMMHVLARAGDDKDGYRIATAGRSAEIAHPPGP